MLIFFALAFARSENVTANTTEQPIENGTASISKTDDLEKQKIEEKLNYPIIDPNDDSDQIPDIVDHAALINNHGNLISNSENKEKEVNKVETNNTSIEEPAREEIKEQPKIESHKSEIIKSNETKQTENTTKSAEDTKLIDESVNITDIENKTIGAEEKKENHPPIEHKEKENKELPPKTEVKDEKNKTSEVEIKKEIPPPEKHKEEDNKKLPPITEEKDENNKTTEVEEKKENLPPIEHKKKENKEVASITEEKDEKNKSEISKVEEQKEPVTDKSATEEKEQLDKIKEEMIKRKEDKMKRPERLNREDIEKKIEEERSKRQENKPDKKVTGNKNEIIEKEEPVAKEEIKDKKGKTVIGQDSVHAGDKKPKHEVIQAKNNAERQPIVEVKDAGMNPVFKVLIAAIILGIVGVAGFVGFKTVAMSPHQATLEESVPFKFAMNQNNDHNDLSKHGFSPL